MSAATGQPAPPLRKIAGETLPIVPIVPNAGACRAPTAVKHRSPTKDVAVLRQDRSLVSGLGSLGWTLLIGLVAWAAFYILLLRGPLGALLGTRYFAEHPVEFAEMALFFVGLSALGMRLYTLLLQQWHLDDVQLADGVAGETDLDRVPTWLESLQASAEQGESQLRERVSAALEWIDRRGTAEGLDTELQRLADQDADRAAESYGLPMLAIWATPMLGFLGTVLGITVALSSLTPESFVGGGEALKESANGLIGGLAAAFDTTGLALTLAMLLMFAKYLVEQVESNLASAVDARTRGLLLGRFQTSGPRDPQVAAVKRMADAVLSATQETVRQQAVLWQSTIDAAHQQWSALLTAAGNQVEEGLVGAMDQAIEAHAAQMARSEEAAAKRSLHFADQMQAMMARTAEQLKEQQMAMKGQGELMLRAIEATGDVTKLQEALHENLGALAGAHRFEETVLSLSAAIQLLNVQLGRGSHKQGVGHGEALPKEMAA